MKRLFGVIIFLLLALPGAVVRTAPLPDRNFTLVFSNDVRGEIAPCG